MEHSAVTQQKDISFLPLVSTIVARAGKLLLSKLGAVTTMLGVGLPEKWQLNTIRLGCVTLALLERDWRRGLTIKIQKHKRIRSGTRE